MHFEILVEDASGKIALENIVEKILSTSEQNHSFRIHAYKGIGRLPKNLRGKTDPRKRILLDRLPKILRGYGKSLQTFSSAVIVVVDLDRKDCRTFKQELLGVLKVCNPAPTTLFRIAIEEGEAWLLGDRNAVVTAYPNARVNVMNNYAQDSICGTWEILAGAVYPGRAAALERAGWLVTGVAKCEWAEKITPHMDVDGNLSPSFRVFRDGLRRLAGMI